MLPPEILHPMNSRVKKYIVANNERICEGLTPFRNYTRQTPVSFSSSVFSGLEKDGKRFSLPFLEIPLILRLGRDHSNNAELLKSCMDGKNSFLTSSIQIDDKKKKIFLLVVMNIADHKAELDKEKTLFVRLEGNYVARCSVNENLQDKSGTDNFVVGTRDDIMRPLTGIRMRTRRIEQKITAARDDNRKAVLQKVLTRVKKKELNIINTWMHRYSKEIVDGALKRGCGRICLKEITKGAVVPSWSYGQLSNMIRYKAEHVGIKII